MEKLTNAHSAMTNKYRQRENNMSIPSVVSKMKKSLPLVLEKAKEGFSKTYGVDIYEGVLTVGEYVESFEVEKNSDEISEKDKMQRDVNVSDSRVRSMKDYVQRGASIFNNVTIFVNKLADVKDVAVGHKTLVVASVPEGAEAHITDGQGRHTTFSSLLAELSDEEREELSSHTLSVKFVVTNTDTVYEVRHIARQCFSDYHLNMVKPSTSLSLYFDTSTPYGRLMTTLLKENINGEELVERISLKGKITGKQVWTLAMFATFVHTALGKTKSNLNKELKDDACFEKTLKLVRMVLPKALGLLPLDVINDNDPDVKKVHNNALFTKALFLTGLGYVVRSLMEQAILTGELNFDALDKVKTLPLTDKTCESLKKARIVDEDDKMISKSDKRVGGYLCRLTGIMPCEALMA